MTVRPVNRQEIAYFADAHRRVYIVKEYRWGPAFCDYAAHIAGPFVRSGGTSFAAVADGRPVGLHHALPNGGARRGAAALFLVERGSAARALAPALVDALLEKGPCLWLSAVDPLTASRWWMPSG